MYLGANRAPNTAHSSKNYPAGLRLLSKHVYPQCIDNFRDHGERLFRDSNDSHEMDYAVL